MLDGLHDFDGSDGAGPEGPLAWWGGAAYGVTYAGGVSQAGTLFRLDEDGLGAFTTLRSFTGSEGHPSKSASGSSDNSTASATPAAEPDSEAFFDSTPTAGARSTRSRRRTGAIPRASSWESTGTFTGHLDRRIRLLRHALRADPSGHLVTLHDSPVRMAWNPSGVSRRRRTAISTERRRRVGFTEAERFSDSRRPRRRPCGRWSRRRDRPTRRRRSRSSAWASRKSRR